MNKSVLVIGAASGIGQELTHLLLERDYAVLCTVMNDKEAEQLRKRFPSIAEIAIVDLADANTAANTLELLIESSKLELSGVIVLAAVLVPGALEMLDLDEYRRSLEVNNVAALMIYQRCMPALRQSKGWIAFISSEAGKVAFPFMGAYISGKHSLEGLCDVMRQEAARFEVDVVIFQPGAIRTNMLSQTRDAILAQIDSTDTAVGNLYREELKTYADFVQLNIDAGIPPKEAATVMLYALETTSPDTRCVIGEDAKELLRLRAELSDREMDNVFTQAYASAGSATDKSDDQ